jgi:hypothetical protein
LLWQQGSDAPVRFGNPKPGMKWTRADHQSSQMIAHIADNRAITTLSISALESLKMAFQVHALICDTLGGPAIATHLVSLKSFRSNSSRQRYFACRCESKSVSSSGEDLPWTLMGRTVQLDVGRRASPSPTTTEDAGISDDRRMQACSF